MWNPIDDIGDFIDDVVDAVRQVKKSGGVRNATRDVANRAATAGAGGGYAAPARAAASEAALRAYEKQAKTYKDIALLADAVLTGGIADPLARAGVASVTDDNKAAQRALLDFAINAGASMAGQKAGEILGNASEKTLANIIGKLNKIIDDKRYEYGIVEVRPGKNIDVIKPKRWMDDKPGVAPGSFFFATTNDAGEDLSDRAASEAARYLRVMGEDLRQIRHSNPRSSFLMDKITPGIAITKVPKGTSVRSVTPLYGPSWTGMRTTADQNVISRRFARPYNEDEYFIGFADIPTVDDIYERLLSITAPSPANVNINPAVLARLAQLAIIQAQNEP